MAHRNFMNSLIDKCDGRSLTYFEIFNETETWEIEKFYVKRFFSSVVEEFKIVESVNFYQEEARLA